ncbi:uncharacterized protein Z518_10378 [Rhinocladiella mackenziei CBS 650.93]|uniref:Uncharacterized protein n=1 Tax=Rhinocladiella mackenziei CBS 650.93 TaxID=1442369 RepID=A0A0D2I386_9EURO|nr:uncharacterized protein Z518_10378 [Rhinocladiella mackenziei CBS 650.93]KIX00239.1 hypothetical protein Z518_10378 [Rhinocladiella mackenziei CBS 650.93]
MATTTGNPSFLSSSRAESGPASSPSVSTPNSNTISLSPPSASDGTSLSKTSNAGTTHSSSSSVSSSVVSNLSAGPTDKTDTSISSHTSGSGTFSSSITSSSDGTSIAATSISSISNAAAPAETSSPSTSPGNGPSNEGLSTGAKAGIGVGVVVFVALIGITAFFFLRRRSRQSRQLHSNRPFHEHQQALNRPEGNYNGGLSEKALPVAVAPYENSPSYSGNEVLLPQQADDATVKAKFSTVYELIELHIENFYQEKSPMIPPAIEGALSRYDTSVLRSPLVHCLEESPRSTTILKHVLSYEISMAAISPGSGNSERSLLPLQLLTAVRDVEREHNQEDEPMSPGHTVSHAPSQAYMRLKHLAATYRSSPWTSNASADSARHFSHVFSLWADPQFEESRRVQHLTEVMESAAKFGVWLFSHPEQFEIRWGDGWADIANSASKETGTHSLVTVPALVKVTGQGGRKLMKEDQKVLSNVVYRRI